MGAGASEPARAGPSGDQQKRRVLLLPVVEARGHLRAEPESSESALGSASASARASLSGVPMLAGPGALPVRSRYGTVVTPP
jgi:hypothetical protein